jgi:ABC-type branched-subunit amino acid transport system substrate-binding protein
VQAVAGELAGIAKEIDRQGLARKSIVAGLQGPWAGPWLRLNAQSMEGWYAVGFFDGFSTRPDVKAFLDRIRARPGGEPVATSLSVEASAYDAVHILAKVMRERAIKPDTPTKEAREKIRAGLANVRAHAGVSGSLSLDKDGETEGLVFTVFRAKEGKWKALQ